MTRRSIALGAVLLLGATWPIEGQWQDKIVFESDHEGHGQIYSVNLDGTELTNLANTERTSAVQPACSPDGRRIALSFGTEIVLIDIDGLNAVLITQDDDTNQLPSWSPDGTQIAFWKSPAFESESHSGLHIINVDGSDLRHIPGAGLAIESTWSPQGDRIAYATGGSEIFIVDIGGENTINTIRELPGGRWPAWSPNGRQIAFRSTIESQWGIFVVNVDGTNLINLTNSPLTHEYSPAWSPDGSQIAFVLGQVSGLGDLYIMDADGMNQTLVLKGEGDINHLSWCPGTSPTLIKEWPWGLIKMRQGALRFPGFNPHNLHPPVLE